MAIAAGIAIGCPGLSCGNDINTEAALLRRQQEPELGEPVVAGIEFGLGELQAIALVGIFFVGSAILEQQYR